jgi:hypothetical protein
MPSSRPARKRHGRAAQRPTTGSCNCFMNRPRLRGTGRTPLATKGRRPERPRLPAWNYRIPTGASESMVETEAFAADEHRARWPTTRWLPLRLSEARVRERVRSRSKFVRIGRVPGPVETPIIKEQRRFGPRRVSAAAQDSSTSDVSRASSGSAQSAGFVPACGQLDARIDRRARRAWVAGSLSHACRDCRHQLRSSSSSMARSMWPARRSASGSVCRSA